MPYRTKAPRLPPIEALVAVAPLPPPPPQLSPQEAQLKAIEELLDRRRDEAISWVARAAFIIFVPVIFYLSARSELEYQRSGRLDPGDFYEEDEPEK